jgi:large subunit ribosomal protein L24
MAKIKVKKGDTVLVIAGKDKGAKGKVIQAYPDRGRVLVEGVNRIKKHTKVSTSQRGSKQGGIVTQEAAIHISNVMVVGSDGKPTRVGYRIEEVTGDDGKVTRKRVRVSRRTGEDI